MKLSAPKKLTFIIAVVLAVLGLVGKLAIPVLAGYSVPALAIAFVLLALGCMLKGL